MSAFSVQCDFSGTFRRRPIYSFCSYAALLKFFGPTGRVPFSRGRTDLLRFSPPRRSSRALRGPLFSTPPFPLRRLPFASRGVPLFFFPRLCFPLFLFAFILRECTHRRPCSFSSLTHFFAPNCIVSPFSIATFPRFALSNGTLSRKRIVDPFPLLIYLIISRFSRGLPGLSLKAPIISFQSPYSMALVSLLIPSSSFPSPFFCRNAVWEDRGRCFLLYFSRLGLFPVIFFFLLLQTLPRLFGRWFAVLLPFSNLSFSRNLFTMSFNSPPPSWGAPAIFLRGVCLQTPTPSHPRRVLNLPWFLVGPFFLLTTF